LVNGAGEEGRELRGDGEGDEMRRWCGLSL